MNIVETKKKELIEMAKKAGYEVYFTQTNGSNFSCTSRVYFAKSGSEVTDCRSKAVEQIYSWEQSQMSGKTVNCERYRVFSLAIAWLAAK